MRVRRPAALAALLRWRHRGTFLTLWTDLHTVCADRVTVRDDGAGIPPAFHDLIFRKFGTVQRAGRRPTSGLGLTFCKLAVEAHGGRIWVESGAEGGAAFHFTLPGVPDGPARRPAALAGAAGRTGD